MQTALMHAAKNDGVIKARQTDQCALDVSDVASALEKNTTLDLQGNADRKSVV